MKALPSLLLAATLLSSCSGGSHGPEAAERLALLVSATPDGSLLAFSATVEEVRLRSAANDAGENVLSAPLPLTWTDSEEQTVWLAFPSVSAGQLGAGGFDRATVRFTASGYSARAKDGSAVGVDVVTDEWTVDLPEPSGAGALQLRLDLADSLSGDVTQGSLLFDPRGAAVWTTGGSAIDEIRGPVLSIDAGASRVVVDAFADGDLQVPLGPVGAVVGAETVLVRDDGGLFGSADEFFASLVAGATLLEIHGRLSGDAGVDARRIEVEDSFASGGDAIEIQGTVLDLVPASGFTLLVEEVEKGSASAAPVLAALADPSRIAVELRPETRYVLDDDGPSGVHAPATADALANGQRVDVRFSSFLAEPFPASRVEIEHGGGAGGVGLAWFEGRIVDLGGLPSAFTIVMENSEPAILSGDVASVSTPVRVEIDGAQTYLGTDGKPALTPGDLRTGQKVEALASLSGEPDQPVLDAARVKVFAGRLDDAFVVAVDSAAASFDIAGGELKDSFGDGVTPGPLTVRIEPSAVFDGEIGSLAALLSTLQGLDAGEQLEVEVHGLGAEEPDTVRAFEIDARVE